MYEALIYDDDTDDEWARRRYESRTEAVNSAAWMVGMFGGRTTTEDNGDPAGVYIWADESSIAAHVYPVR